MSRNGSGIYNLPTNSWNPAVNGNSATAADWQSLIDDVESALTQSVSSDGQTPITGNLNLNGNKITSLGAATSSGDALRFQQLFSQGVEVDVASSATTDIGLQNSNFLRITGTTTITSFGTNYNGPRFVRFSDALILTHNASTLILPTSANITTVAGDRAIVIPVATAGTANGWQVVAYQRASGQALVSATDFLNTTRVDVASAATVDLTANAPNTRNINITGTTSITAFTVAAGQTYFVRFASSLTLTNNASIVTQTGGNITTFSGDTCIIRATAANVVEVLSYVTSSNLQAPVPVRQTVISGPVDSSGLPNFGGSTGSSTVTMSGTLYVSAANGIVNRSAYVTNASWTGLTTAGTMYLYLNIADDGTVTTGSTTLAPTYRWGGADVVTNNQHTFNIQEMTMKVGNGSAATQVYRVFVGEVTVAGSVVTAITWYALMGRYQSPDTAISANGTAMNFNHNIGVIDVDTLVLGVNQTAEFGFTAGQMKELGAYVSDAQLGSANLLTRSAASLNSSGGWYVGGTPSTGGSNIITNANWKIRFCANRRW